MEDAARWRQFLQRLAKGIVWYPLKRLLMEVFWAIFKSSKRTTSTVPISHICSSMSSRLTVLRFFCLFVLVFVFMFIYLILWFVIFQAWDARSFEGAHHRRREAEMGSSVRSVAQREASTIETGHWKIKENSINTYWLPGFWAHIQLHYRPIWVCSEKKIHRRNPFQYDFRWLRPVW